MQEHNSLNLIEVIAAIKKSSKQIIVFMLLSLVIAFTVLLMIPKYFQSTAIVVAANPALADKARFFNNNIQGLYSNFGSGDDLDRIYGLANLDTTYKLLVDEFDLISYYKLKNDSIKLLRRKAVLLLKDDLELSKTDLSQLKISVWHKDNKVAAAIANRTVKFVQEMEEGFWKNNYQSTLENLQTSITKMENEVKVISDSLVSKATNSAQTMLLNNKREVLLQQLQQYQKTADEYRLASNNKTPALYILEDAVPAAKAEKPKKLETLVLTAITSLCFGVFASLAYSRNKMA
jgi:uncharacterized protein involved in exopolysaccharide biosynthesis